MQGTHINLEDPECIEQLVEQVKALPGYSIHCSIECRPWSQWQHLNKAKKPPLIARIEEDKKAIVALLCQFVRVADVCLDQRGNVIEWPRYCSGWPLGPLLDWILLWILHSNTFGGCTVGVTANNMPARKPWGFVTSPARLASSLSALVCNHQSHAPLQGKWTRMSVFYPPRLLRNLMIYACASHITRWSPNDDKLFARIAGYIAVSLQYSFLVFVKGES